VKYFFITQGTKELLEKIMQQHANEEMHLFHNDITSILVHETTKKSIFTEPRKYVVVESSGQLISEGFIILHYVPVTDEGRPVFEFQFKRQHSFIENSSGLIALKLLRPMENDTYIVLSQWQNEKSFEAGKKNFSSTLIDKNQQTPLYPRPSYIKRFYSHIDE